MRTGFPSLDKALPFNGWPTNGITEIHSAVFGQGALSLLLPAVRDVSHNSLVAWVAPPYLPYSAALKHFNIALEHLLVIRPQSTQNAHWAVEECLKSQCCGLVLYWPEKPQSFKVSRRQQILCQEYQVPLFTLFESSNTSPSNSTISPNSHTPCSLRLNIEKQTSFRIQLQLDKCKGRWAGEQFSLDLPHDAFWRYPFVSNITQKEINAPTPSSNTAIARA